MGMPKVDGKARVAGAKYLAAFIEDMKASGFVADALKRSGQTAGWRRRRADAAHCDATAPLAQP